MQRTVLVGELCRQYQLGWASTDLAELFYQGPFVILPICRYGCYRWLQNTSKVLC